MQSNYQKTNRSFAKGESDRSIKSKL